MALTCGPAASARGPRRGLQAVVHHRLLSAALALTRACGQEAWRASVVGPARSEHAACPVRLGCWVKSGSPCLLPLREWVPGRGRRGMGSTGFPSGTPRRLGSYRVVVTAPYWEWVQALCRGRATDQNWAADLERMNFTSVKSPINRPTPLPSPLSFFLFALKVEMTDRHSLVPSTYHL